MKRICKYLIFLCIVLAALAGLMVLAGDASAVDAHLDDGGWEWHYDDTDDASKSILTRVVQTGAGTEVDIPAHLSGTIDILTIAANCFKDAEGAKITKVLSMPATVTSIGASAFENCILLTSCDIGTSVTSIGTLAFSYTAITSITIPNSVTTIGNNAFAPCTALTSVTIGSGVTTLGERLFNGCTALTTITIPNTITTIGDWAFYECSGLTSVTIGGGVTTIADYAFRSCTSLSSITIPSSVTSIGFAEFYDDVALKSLYFLGNAPTLGALWISGIDSGYIIYYPLTGTGYDGASWTSLHSFPFFTNATYVLGVNTLTATLTGDDAYGISTIISNNAAYTMTLDLDGYSLSATSITAGTRGVVMSSVAGAKITTTAEITVSANGQLDATNIAWINCGTNWDTSAGTWKPGTNQVNMTSTGTTKLAAGQYFYNLLAVNGGVTRTLLSDVVVQNHKNILGTLTQGIYSVTINGTSITPLEANGTWSGIINITSTGASYTIWTSVSWTGTIQASKVMTIIYSGGQLVVTPPASTWYNVTMKGWTGPNAYKWYAGSTTTGANISFAASTLNVNGRYDVYLDGAYSTYKIADGSGVVTYYHSSWSGHMITLKSLAIITSGAPSTSILEDIAYYYNGTADQSGTWSIVTLHLWMAVGAADGKVSGTPDNLDVAIRIVSLQLTNVNGTAYLNWTLTVVNVAPVFLNSAPTTITQLSNYSYDANSTDEGFGAGYSLNEPTGQITLDGTTGIMYGAIHLYQNISIIFWVDDGNGGVTYQNFTLVVFAAISSTPGTVILEDQVYSYWGISNQTGTWTLVTNASFLYLAGNLVCGTGNNLYAAQWYVLNLTLTNTNGSAWQNWTLNVTNVAPVFTTLPPSENGVRGNKYYYDPTCDDETIGAVYSMVTISPDLRCDPASGVVQGRFMDVFASLTISIMADDGHGGVTWQNWTIEVLPGSYIIHVDIIFQPGQKLIVHFEYTTDLEPILFDKVVWNFGDGVGSIKDAPNHIYERVGWYYVTCAVYDIWGNVGYQTVKVGAGNPADQATELEKVALWLQTDFIMMISVVMIGFLGATGYSRYTKKTKGGPNFWIIVIWISVCLVLGLMIGGRFLWAS